jgi:hypothetical protein
MATVDGATLSPAELVALVEADTLSVDAGLELLDSHDVMVADITDDFVADGSSVERGVYRTVHGTARLNISRELVWGSQRLRPYLLLSSDGDTFYRWDLGVFLPTTPEREVADDPPVWSVDCFDKLDILNTPMGRSYSLDASDNLIAAVVELIEDAGETRINIEPSDAVAGSARVMSLVDDWTVLTVCNELLASAGYRGLYVDSDGYYRSEPYRLPADLPTTWKYCTSSQTTTVGEQRTATADYYRAANYVVGINDDVEGDVPVEGAGVYWEDNQADGLTSIEARGGRIIRRVITGKFASQAALVVAVQQALDTEKNVANHVTINVSPTPVHGHFDVVDFRDDDMGAGGRWLVTDWVLPLDGSDMTLSLRGV